MSAECTLNMIYTTVHYKFRTQINSLLIAIWHLLSAFIAIFISSSTRPLAAAADRHQHVTLVGHALHRHFELAAGLLLHRLGAVLELKLEAIQKFLKVEVECKDSN